MASLQSTSLKISKEPKNNYMCGACSKILKSYPALFQHIKLRHQGIRPPHTKVVKQAPPSNSKPLRNINSRSSGLYTQPMISTPTSQQVQPSFVGTAQTGRPSKPLHNIDDLSYAELCIEETQNELLGFLGERLMVISGFEDKLKLEDAIGRIQLPKEKTDKWFSDVQNECQVLYRQYGEDINLDFEEEFKNLNPDNGLGILVWFLLWLGKHFVKREFILDLAIVISKIWKVLESTQLQVQDLDNKLVWKKAMAECKIVVDDLPFFRRDEELIYEFIQKLCQLIGKAFEQLG